MVEQLAQMTKEASQNKGIIITDHLYRSVLLVSDRLMLMTSGALKAVSDSADLEDAGYLTTDS